MPIDARAISSHFENDTALYREALEIFDSSWRNTFNDLCKAITDREFALAERFAHTLKGNLRMFHVFDEADKFRNLENLARNGDSGLDAVDLSGLQNSIEIIFTELKDLADRGLDKSTP